jgi:predicted component of type VI protein secretion system
VKLEIRNLSSSASYTIDPDGAVLGREGSKADIILRDQAVSKKHAKIYEKNGKWYLEDLASSNGTFLENRRITEPVILTPGSVFALSENQFEVVQIVNGKAALDMETDAADSPDRNVLDDLPPLGMTPGDSVDGEGKRSRPMRSSPSSRIASPAQAGADPADLGDEGAEKQGFGFFMVAIPKAIAYYLAAVPLMALNPVGSIRKSIENQKLPALGPFPLIAYAAPVNVFSLVIGVVVGMIAALINGVFTLPIVPLIMGVAIALVVSAIGGFLVHPLGKLVINRWLKGDSDDKSRTNWYITQLTASALVAIGGGLAGIIAAIPVPFINVLPAVIVFAGSMISFFVFYSWFKYFNVVNWFNKVMMVLGVLVLLQGAWGVVSAVLASISGLGSGGGVNMAAVGTAGDLTAEQKAALEAAGANVEEAQKRAQEMLEKSGAVNADAQEAMKKAMAAATDPANAEALVKQAQENAKAMQAAAEKTAAAAQKEADKAEKTAAAVDKAAEKTAKEEDEEDMPKKPEKPVLAAAPVEDDEVARPTKAALTTTSNTPAGAGPSGAFQEFIQQRKEVDDAIEKDPTLLKKKDLLTSYEKYLRKTFEVRARWKKKKAKDEAGQRINDRLKDIEVYEETAKMVTELHRKIFR